MNNSHHNEKLFNANDFVFARSRFHNIEKEFDVYISLIDFIVNLKLQ